MKTVTDVKILRNVLQQISVALSIISSAIAIVVYVRVDKLAQFIGEGIEWDLTIAIREPTDDEEVRGVAVRVKGEVDFRATARDWINDKRNIHLTIYENSTELVCLVRTAQLNEHAWIVQPKPIVEPNGSFDGLVFVNNDSSDVLNQLIVLIAPRGQLEYGEKYDELPFYYGASNTVAIWSVANQYD